MDKQAFKLYLIKNRHTLIPYGVPVLLLMLAWFLVISPSLSKVDELKFMMADKEQNTRHFKTLLMQETLFRKDLKRAKEELDRIDSLVPSQGTGEKLVKNVLSFAKEKSVGIASLEAGNTIKGARFDEITLKIGMEGSFSNQLALFHKLETQVPPYIISNLAMRSNEKGGLKTVLTLKALVRNAQNQ